MDSEIQTPAEDEAALDAEILASIDAVRAGNKLEETPVASVDTPAKETPAPAATVEDASKPPVAENKEGYEFRIPNKGKFESDEAFEKRIELLDLVKQRKAATTPEKKQELSEKINTAKGQLRNIGTKDSITNPPNTDVDPNAPGEDPAIAADKARLRELGGITKEDMEAIVAQERFATEQRTALETFVGRHEELKDEDVREVFFQFVDQNFLWSEKSGKDLIATLELAKEAMFKPSETIQERVLKGADVAEKINAMDFPGGTGTRQGFSPEMQKSIDELKGTGMSEEKAIELLSD
jgi:hypothetical protein